MSRLASARIACFMGLIITSLPQKSHSSGAGEALSGDAGMARCAAITEPGARLACFDALAAASANRGAPALGQPAQPVPPAIAPTAIAPSASPGDSRAFGLSQAQSQPRSLGPSSIKARVATINAGQLGVGHPTVVLDNGQTWVFSEAVDDPRLAPGATVTIKRAAFGSFLLTTASQHLYHVHRTQ